jgi:hypothetical protein
MAEWEQHQNRDESHWQVVRPAIDGSGEQKYSLLDDGSLLAQGYSPTKPISTFTIDVTTDQIRAIRLELLNDPNLPHCGPGRSIYGLCALTEFEATVAPLSDLGARRPLKLSAPTADVNPPEKGVESIFDDRSGNARVTGPVAYACDGNHLTAWGIDVGPGRSNVPHQAVFQLEEPIDASQGVRLTLHLLQFHGSYHEASQSQNLGRFRFAVSNTPEAAAEKLPAAVRQALAVPQEDRTAAQEDVIFSYWRTQVPEWSDANRRIEGLWQSHPRGISQLVLKERAECRKTYVHDRGDFLKPTAEVTPSTPKFLHTLESTAAMPNRLDFARWLVDRRSPTTARSIVNRLWQAYFGVGLVSSADDLGTQGDLPTHPELLDWLAVELMEHDWSLKHIHRLIVSSATYQQSSVVSPELLERDPANSLLARGPRFRVDAEMVRDIALAASGLMKHQVGGPSVCPPAPSFLFEPPASFMPKPWALATNRDQYRRALYTFKYRSVPYPALETFDAPRGDVACVRRARSNTPLQALTSLNESLFLECARMLAQRTIAEGGDTDDQRLVYAMRCCTSRKPDNEELATLRSFLKNQRQEFAADEAAAQKLVGGAPAIDEPVPPGFTWADVAAWTATARVILNLDETITKN